ncbi:hypothetical protein BDF14DRAFT_1790647 [Spinellus fusiger]|nr:hypothetical protein BDF14DRAFT_1790647 [Spinellus fusiger]
MTKRSKERSVPSLPTAANQPILVDAQQHEPKTARHRPFKPRPSLVQRSSSLEICEWQPFEAEPKKRASLPKDAILLSDTRQDTGMPYFFRGVSNTRLPEKAITDSPTDQSLKEKEKQEKCEPFPREDLQLSLPVMRSLQKSKQSKQPKSNKWSWFCCGRSDSLE